MLFDLDFKAQVEVQSFLLFAYIDGKLKYSLCESLKLDSLKQTEIKSIGNSSELIDHNNPSMNDFIAHWSVMH